jgi:hypothetical protein
MTAALPLRKGLTALCLAMALLIAGCGGGDGDASTDDGGGTGSGDGGGSPPPAADPNAVGAAFKEGDFLEYYARAHESSIVQGSSGSTREDAVQFRLSLGAPVQANGLALFPITITGRTTLLDSIEVAPRWHYLGSAGGKLYGSVDGRNVEAVYSPDGALSGFFVQRDPAQPAALSTRNFTGDYLNASAIAAGNSQSSGGCQVIAGYQICSDDSASASAYEYFKDGVGPLGFGLSRSSSSNGGGFYTSFTTTYEVELTGTSLAGAGVAFGTVPHEVAAMNHARQHALATVHDGRIFVFGRKAEGSGTEVEPSEIEVYDPATQAWNVIGQTPAAMNDYAATAIGDESYFVGSGPLYAYDHLRSSWSIPLQNSPVLNLSEGKDVVTVAGKPPVTRTLRLAIWTAPEGERRIVLIEVEQFLVLRTSSSGNKVGLPETDFFLNVYSPAAKAWAPLGGFSLDKAFPLDGAIVSDDQLILSSGSNAAPVTVDLTQLEYSTDSRTASPNGRSSSAASAAVEGVAQYIGGVVQDNNGHTEDYARQVEAYDSVTDTWTLGTRLLLGRTNSAAVVLDGKVYVLGGLLSDGAVSSRVEAYRP